MAKTEKKEKKIITLPEGRVINSSLFEKDAFDDKSTPAYKIELAFSKGDKVLDDFFTELLEFADETWGAPANEDDLTGTLNIDGGKIISGVVDGDFLAAKREKKGKAGDAYKGQWIIRATTIYNKDGVNAPGGIQVYDEEVKDIGVAAQAAVYSGCYGQAAVTLDDYEDDKSGNNGIKIYLSAFQKTRDGERLVTARDHSTLFKPVGRPQAPAGEAAKPVTRRNRKG